MVVIAFTVYVKSKNKKKISFLSTENLHCLQLNKIAEMLYIVSESECTLSSCWYRPINVFSGRETAA